MGRIALPDPHVARLTPKVSGGSGRLSGEVELEGWVTSTALAPANYNNSRSNKSTIRAPDGDEDAVDDDAVRGEDYNTPRSNRSIAGPSDIIDDDIIDDDTKAGIVLSALARNVGNTKHMALVEHLILDSHRLDNYDAIKIEIREILGTRKFLHRAVTELNAMGRGKGGNDEGNGKGVYY